MDDSGNADYSLICPFLTDDPVFAHGVEFGMLVSQMIRRKEEINEYIRTENEEQVRVAASRYGYEINYLRPWEYEGEETGWVFIKMARR